ncbi:hypothetical protein BTS2_2699 [Bacillus sp. TS-2]|nr:hypothetical protein BTS2_2699 [Bacillus sp. TS-2]
MGLYVSMFPLISILLLLLGFSLKEKKVLQRMCFHLGIVGLCVFAFFYFLLPKITIFIVIF